MTTDEIFSLRQLIREEFHPGMKALMSELFIEELENINHKLERLLTMAVSQADFDVALQGVVDDLSAQITAIDAAVQAIINKVGTAVDLTAETATLTNIKTSLDGIVGQLPTTLTTPPSGG